MFELWANNIGGSNVRTGWEKRKYWRRLGWDGKGLRERKIRRKNVINCKNWEGLGKYYIPYNIYIYFLSLALLAQYIHNQWNKWIKFSLKKFSELLCRGVYFVLKSPPPLSRKSYFFKCFFLGWHTS